MSYHVRKRFSFVTGERRFVALEVEFERDRAGKASAELAFRVERELYVVDDSGLELFVGYVGQLHELDARLRPLQRRVAMVLDHWPTIAPRWREPSRTRGEVTAREAWDAWPMVLAL